jgi:hypothetical protein
MSVEARRELSIDDPIAGPGVAEAHATNNGAGRLLEIPLEHIQPNPEQPRKRLDQDSLCRSRNQSASV